MKVVEVQVMKIAIIIPAYNESRHLDGFFSTLIEKLSTHSHLDLKRIPIVLVDDGSIDGTAKIASKYTKYVLSHTTNLGKGAALKTGCEFAFNHLKVEYIIMIDSDEQHSPDDLLKFIDKIDAGHNLILGVRSFNGMPIIPTISNKLTSFFIKCVYGVYIPDIPSGYKAIGKQTYQKIKWKATG